MAQSKPQRVSNPPCGICGSEQIQLLKNAHQTVSFLIV